MSDNTQTQEVGVVTGKVISNKMDKSIVVLVERQIRHPMYGKQVRRSPRRLYRTHQRNSSILQD